MGKIDLDKIDTGAPKGWEKDQIKAETNAIIEEISEQQKLLVANESHSLLIILQGMDAAGKDGTVRTIFSGINPSSCHVVGFKKPTALEYSHDFLWRVHQVAPKNGEIVVFNRSHYEDILVPKVEGYLKDEIVERRYNHINNFEQLLTDNNTTILKFYLHTSKDEQLRRLKERLVMPHKYWKHNDGDWDTREKWDEYRKVYHNIFEKCDAIPWHIVPADKNWVKVNYVAKEILKAMKAWELDWPPLKTEKFNSKK